MQNYAVARGAARGPRRDGPYEEGFVRLSSSVHSNKAMLTSSYRPFHRTCNDRLKPTAVRRPDPMHFKRPVHIQSNPPRPLRAVMVLLSPAGRVRTSRPNNMSYRVYQLPRAIRSGWTWASKSIVMELKYHLWYRSVLKPSRLSVSHVHRRLSS